MKLADLEVGKEYYHESHNTDWDNVKYHDVENFTESDLVAFLGRGADA